ncbi:MAG: hypothetical protein DRH90_01845 [Deltaproteobacteria bacterium]|nr:MAG: hypothetical protein DRH90_01845 [Deltaproteobacteria bacterium]RLC18692.1 MAG: hypothetical protein DRI24_02290 [Deltaproteobacteria bacterium]
MLLQQKGLRIRSSGRLGTTFDVSRKITACILKSGIMNAQAPPELGQGVRQQIFDFYASLLVDDLGIFHELLPEMHQENSF